MITTRLFISLFLSGLLMFSCNEPEQSVQLQDGPARLQNSDSLIQRIVCFKFRTTATQVKIEQHMKGFAGLKDSIPQMLTYRAGPTVKGDLGQNSEYDVMHYSTYQSEDDIKIYSVHPVHLRFIEQNKGSWDKVLVINSKFLPHQPKEN